MDAPQPPSDGTPRFVLFLGNAQPDAAASRLKASGVQYVRKQLESRPANWTSIRSLLNDPGLVCVVGKLNAQAFNLFAAPAYADVATSLLDALSRVPHALFAHEAVITGREAEPEPEADLDDASWTEYLRRSGYFRSPTEDVRTAVARFFERYRVRMLPYSTNAEFEVMADAFVADNERDLLFRVYVPAGRLYAAEADKLLSLFRDWLTKVAKQSIRQAGYETAAGHMYEFYGDGRPRSRELAAEFTDFSAFLDLCVDDPSAAEAELTALGLDRRTGAALVSRYGKEARRLRLDLDHEHELRVVAIRHQLEAEVLEGSLGGDFTTETLDRLVSSLLPSPRSGVAGVLSPRLVAGAVPPIQVQINQQVIETVTGTVVQSVQGTTNVGPEARELLELIERYGRQDAADLTTAVHELEDVDAAVATRVRAKQLLKGFMIKLGGVADDVATAALTKYVEGKIGV